MSSPWAWTSVSGSRPGPRSLLDVGVGQRATGRPHELRVLLRRRRRRDVHDRVVAVGRDVLAGVSPEALAIATLLNRANAPADLLPEDDDAAIGGSEVFQAMDRDGPL